MSRISRRRRHRCGERGAAAVEFGLILIPLIMLLMGTVTGGFAYFQKISMADAMREGARFGATTDFTDASTWTAAVKDRTVEAATGVLDTSDPNTVVCVDTPGGSSCPVAPDTDTPTPPVGSCYVHVYVKKPLWFSIGVYDWSPVVEEDAYARYERTCP